MMSGDVHSWRTSTNEVKQVDPWNSLASQLKDKGNTVSKNKRCMVPEVLEVVLSPNILEHA